MQTTVFKTIRLELKNSLGQKIQVTPEEAWWLADRLKGALEDADVKRPTPPIASIHGEPVAAAVLDLAEVCPEAYTVKTQDYRMTPTGSAGDPPPAVVWPPADRKPHELPPTLLGVNVRSEA
jgi:hypothetical protein